MKVPVGIDLRRASFTRCQFGKRVDDTRKANLGPVVGGSEGSFTPFQIIARASVARANCDWDKAAILS